MKAIAYLLFIGIGLNTLQAQDRLKSTCYRMEQPNCPLKIESYTCRYYDYNTDGIYHKVTYTNTSDSVITAVQFGFISFDVFNKFLDKTYGVTVQNLQPGSQDKGTWVVNDYADFMFLTGVVYISKVRFNDGSIWEVDMDYVLAKLAKLNFIFDQTKVTEDKPDENTSNSVELK